MNIPKISVVIPAFNTESYLGRTLRNIAEEQFGLCKSDYWEIIVVNDGSTDGTEAVALQWKDRYPDNIRVLSQPNSGVSAARNRGIEEARGEYIYFMDSDDLLRQGALPDLVSTASKSRLDMIAFNFTEITESEYAGYAEQAPMRIPLPEPAVTTSTDYLWETSGMERIFCPYAACCVFFKRNFLTDNNLRYSTHLALGEDTLFNIYAVIANPRITWITIELYLYNNQRTGNASSGRDRNYMIRAAEKRLAFIQEAAKLKDSIRSKKNIPQTTLRVINDSIIHSYYVISTYYILTNASLGKILKSRRIFKNAGGKAGIGRPRFIPSASGYSAMQQVKRWILAYPIMGICGIIDWICGKGLWRNITSMSDAQSIARAMEETPDKRIALARKLREENKHRRILVVTDIFDHRSAEADIIKSYRSSNSVILVYARDFAPGSFERAVELGYFPFKTDRFNGRVTDSVEERSYLMANMAAMQGIDEILLYPANIVDTTQYDLTCPVTIIS